MEPFERLKTELQENAVDSLKLSVTPEFIAAFQQIKTTTGADVLTRLCPEESSGIEALDEYAQIEQRAQLQQALTDPQFQTKPIIQHRIEIESTFAKLAQRLYHNSSLDSYIDHHMEGSRVLVEPLKAELGTLYEGAYEETSRFYSNALELGIPDFIDGQFLSEVCQLTYHSKIDLRNDIEHRLWFEGAYARAAIIALTALHHSSKVDHEFTEEITAYSIKSEIYDQDNKHGQKMVIGMSGQIADGLWDYESPL